MFPELRKLDPRSSRLSSRPWRWRIHTGVLRGLLLGIQSLDGFGHEKQRLIGRRCISKPGVSMKAGKTSLRETRNSHASFNFVVSNWWRSSLQLGRAAGCGRRARPAVNSTESSMSRIASTSSGRRLSLPATPMTKSGGADKEDTYSGISQLIIGRDRRSRCQRRWYKACSNLETVSMPKGPYFVRSGYPQYPCLGFGHDFIQPDFAECRARGPHRNAFPPDTCGTSADTKKSGEPSTNGSSHALRKQR